LGNGHLLACPIEDECQEVAKMATPYGRQQVEFVVHDGILP
jgi:hypothetical protein